MCQITGGHAQPNMETSEVVFFPQNQIPIDLSISRTLPNQIDLCFEHHKNPALQTDVRLEIGDWGLEIGDWRLGIGDWGIGH